MSRFVVFFCCVLRITLRLALPLQCDVGTAFLFLSGTFSTLFFLFFFVPNPNPATIPPTDLRMNNHLPPSSSSPHDHTRTQISCCKRGSIRTPQRPAVGARRSISPLSAPTPRPPKFSSTRAPTKKPATRTVARPSTSPAWFVPSTPPPRCASSQRVRSLPLAMSTALPRSTSPFGTAAQLSCARFSPRGHRRRLPGLAPVTRTSFFRP